MTAEFGDVDIVRTPTLQAVASADEQVLVADLESKVAEAIAAAEAQPEVVEALSEQNAAEDRFRRLQAASRSLNAHSKELRERMKAAGEKTLDGLIESAAAGLKPDYTAAKDLVALEHRDRLAGKAIERLVEHLVPLALIARLRGESHGLEARAKAIEGAAQHRAERLLGQLRDAVSDEIVLPVDLSKGVAGAMLAQAAELRRVAREAAGNADQIERAYMERNRPQ